MYLVNWTQEAKAGPRAWTYHARRCQRLNFDLAPLLIDENVRKGYFNPASLQQPDAHGELSDEEHLI